MICNNCGTEIPDYSRFCLFCGCSVVPVADIDPSLRPAQVSEEPENASALSADRGAPSQKTPAPDVNPAGTTEQSEPDMSPAGTTEHSEPDMSPAGTPAVSEPYPEPTETTEPAEQQNVTTFRYTITVPPVPLGLQRQTNIRLFSKNIKEQMDALQEDFDRRKAEQLRTNQ